MQIAFTELCQQIGDLLASNANRSAIAAVIAAAEGKIRAAL